MALVNCPECGREKISDKVEHCPVCGYPVREHFINKYNELEKKKKNKEIGRAHV